MRAKRILGFGCALAAIAFAFQQVYQDNLPADHPAIRYTSPGNDPASALDRKLASGEVKLDYRADDLGYLPSLLSSLDINPDTQALVFSKTSFQAPKISPRNPRAIYFNDNVAVGWVRGGAGFEIAALDPRQGVMFYTLASEKTDHPRLARQTVCLRCHQGPATEGVPGIFIGSVFPNSAGDPYREGAIITDHRTAFKDRWGGWYITAAAGEQPDRANGIAPDPEEPEAIANRGLRNLTSLIRIFNPAGYLEPSSDIVALMTFEHQTQAVNMMTRLNWESRLGKAEAVDRDIESLAKYLLFSGEARLPEPVRGVSSFTQTFPKAGPRDHLGRSLRDFDLNTRLFRYPLSYTIYSESFEALPTAIRERIYRQISGRLTGIAPGDRRAILEILRDTKPDLPAYFFD
ncbi:MAG TPA: hypothetical protein VKS01_04385 [Bryobacteraceae bacterium]|nr:hypothetical protein [Bryobacteraceae bacterium]